VSPLGLPLLTGRLLLRPLEATDLDALTLSAAPGDNASGRASATTLAALPGRRRFPTGGARRATSPSARAAILGS
jgi:hypothetical protein